MGTTEIALNILAGVLIIFIGLWLRSVEMRLREKVDKAFCSGRKETLTVINERLMRIENKMMEGKA